MMREKFLSQKKEKREPKKEEEKIILSSLEYIEKMEELGLLEHAKTYKKVLEIAKAIKEAGGQALLVGGAVRDMIMGVYPKDFDIEVYKLPPKKVEEIVNRFGKVSDVGKAFGILKVFLKDGLDIDVSLPRTDSKIEAGHKGFEVKTDPYMSIEDAARRRDFTINSVAYDPLENELYNPFGGVEDIKNRILRVTDPERFRDDPLRVMRALQFIGRFGLEIHKDTIPILREMTPQLKELPKERIGEEWKKLLLKAEKPSLGLEAGVILGVFRELHPEFPLSIESSQGKKSPPESDLWIYTLMSVDEAAKIIRREELSEKKAITIMLSVLCTDLGKAIPERFEEKDIQDKQKRWSEELVRKFLSKIGIDNLTKKKVIKLISHYLVPTKLYIEEIVRGNKVKDGVIRNLAKEIDPATIQELVLVSEADHLGRGVFIEPEIAEQLLLPQDKFLPREWLIKRARALKVEKSRPVDLTRGRDWLNFGYTPGPHIGVLIDLSNRLRDEKDFSKEMVFQLVDGIEDPKEAIKILKAKLVQKE